MVDLVNVLISVIFIVIFKEYDRFSTLQVDKADRPY